MNGSDESRALAQIASTDDESALRTRMKNARHRSVAVHRAALARLVEISVQAEDDPVARACWKMVHTIEEIRRDMGRRVWKMNRLRPKIARGGAVAAIEYCALNETDGFREVLDYGLPELTAEAIVLGFPETFRADVRDRARERLAAAGVDPTLYERQGQA